MSNTWRVQDAKDRFAELLEAALREGPQVLTQGGVETAVLVRMDQWSVDQKDDGPSIKELLISPEGRVEQLTPPRQARQHREPPTIE